MVGVFPSPKQHVDLHLVLTCQKRARLVYLKINIVLAGLRPQSDLLEFRHALEGVAAYYAALRSTKADRSSIQEIYDELETYHEAKAFEQEVKADVEFHLRIAEASHNVVLLHTMRALLGLIEKNIMNNLSTVYPQRGHRSKIHGQHKVLMEAIFEGRPSFQAIWTYINAEVA